MATGPRVALAGPLQPHWVPKIGVSFKRHLNGNLLPVQTIVNLLQGGGAKSARFDTMWADCETSPGVYNFSDYMPPASTYQVVNEPDNAQM
ncbi:hypothetical protein ACFQ15_00355 [Sphingomonas hankookensis]|uniref:hypothetical protein n=1 Tax=Sphingomonas hankookensis TaxID=563996 RepID=UPI001F598EB2|nr:hypothetical protein [Sphingomonas hankookensis]